MNAKSATSRIALTMFCAGALSLGMAPAAMADEPPVEVATKSEAVVPAGAEPSVSETSEATSVAAADEPPTSAEATSASVASAAGEQAAPSANNAAVAPADADAVAGAAVEPAAEAQPAPVAPEPVSQAPAASMAEDAPAAAAEVVQPWAAVTTQPSTFQVTAAAAQDPSDPVLVTAVGDQGWKKTVPDFGHGRDGAFSVQFTDSEVVFSDPDAYVDMGLYKTGLNLGIAEVSESHVEGQDAHLRLTGAMGRRGQTPVEVTFESGSPTAILRIGDGRDAVTTSGLTPEQLRARQDLADVRFTSAEVGYKNTAEPTGHTATVRSVTIGGTTYDFHAQHETVYVGQAGQAGWNQVRPTFGDMLGTGGTPAQVSSTTTFTGQGVVFSDPDARVWMGLRKTGLNVDLPTAANVELTGMNDAHLRLTGRGPSGSNVELTFLPGPDSNVIVRVGGVSTTQTRDELRANSQVQGATFTTAEVGYKNTAEPAGRDVWVGALTIGNTDYVFHADPTVHFGTKDEVTEQVHPAQGLVQLNPLFVDTVHVESAEQTATPDATPQLPVPQFHETVSLGWTVADPCQLRVTSCAGTAGPGAEAGGVEAR